MSIATLTLIRDHMTDTATMGRLFIGNDFAGYTLERPWLDNQRNVSCIPVGNYQGAVQPSPRFGRSLPELLDVPGRSQILIHPGNRVADSQGCILLGQERNVETEEVYGSRAAVQALLDRLEGHPDGFALDIYEDA